MTPETIIKQAESEGVMLTLSPAGSVKAAGNREAVERWLPVIREHKPGILEAMLEAGHVQEYAEERAAILEYDAGQSRQQAEANAGIVHCMGCQHYDPTRKHPACKIGAARPWLRWERGDRPVVLAVCGLRTKEIDNG